MAYWMIVGLWLLYLALTANLEVRNLLLGLVVATGMTLLMRPPRGTFSLRRLPIAGLALAQYLLVIAYDVVKSAVATAQIVLHPDLPVQPGIVAIPSGCHSELGIALSAHAITLAPGEMVVEIGQDGILYTHALDATHAAEYVVEAQRLRSDLLHKIFP